MSWRRALGWMLMIAGVMFSAWWWLYEVYRSVTGQGEPWKLVVATLLLCVLLLSFGDVPPAGGNRAV